jgi:hypothetical protein
LPPALTWLLPPTQTLPALVFTFMGMTRIAFLCSFQSVFPVGGQGFADGSTPSKKRFDTGARKHGVG